MKSKSAIYKLGLCPNEVVALLKVGSKFYELYDVNEAKAIEVKSINFGDKEVEINDMKEVPSNLATKRKLYYNGFNPIGEVYATVKIGEKIYELYEVDKVEPISIEEKTILKDKKTIKTIQKKEKDIRDKYIVDYNEGLPVYSCKWRQLPPHLKANNGFKKRGFKPTGNIVAYLKLNSQIYNLYDYNDKKALNNLVSKPSKKNKKEKKETYKVKYFNTFTLFEDEMIKYKNEYVVLDTETTGIMHDDEIIQLSIVNLDGEVLYNSYFKPQKQSHWGALKKHKLTDEFLADKPLWKDEWYKIAKILKTKNVLIHNATFDQRLIEQTCSRYNIEIDFKIDSYCTMLYCKNKYGYSKLETVLEKNKISFDSDVLHNSLVDCFMTLKVIYPDSIVFNKQKEAQRLFDLACEMKIKAGDLQGRTKGIQWLYKTYSISNGIIKPYISLRISTAIVESFKNLA